MTKGFGGIAHEASPESRSAPGTRQLGCATALVGLFIAVLALSGPPAFGQAATSSLTGTVYDSSGAVIPNAKVALTNQATNVAHTTTSNNVGYFSFSFLQPATYTLTITAEGFKPWEQRDIVLNLGQSRTVPNIALHVGAPTQAVEVVATAQALVSTETGENSATLNQSMVSNIGIQGRNAGELIKILPGMAIIGQGSMLSNTQYTSLTTQTNSGVVGQYSASGTQPYGGLQLTLDGGVIVDTGNMGTQTANINQDQTAELTVRNSAFDAEYTHGPVTVSATSKTGGSRLHGEGYMYARGGTFNAADSNFKAHGIPKPNDHYWYPGFNVGGPVRFPHSDFNKNNDKLFFFTGFEYMIQHPEGALHEVFVPTANMLNGNFTTAELAGFQGHGWDTAGIPCAPGNSSQWWWNNFCGTAAGQTIANGQIPSNLIDPIGQNYMKLFPKPNIDPTTHQGYNWQGVDNPPVNRWELKVRGDYNITDNTRLYVSYNRQHEEDINNYGIWWVPASVVPYPSSFPATQISNLWSAGVTHVFTPTLTNETTFNYTSFINPIKFANPAAADPSKVGVNLKLPYDAKVAPMIPNTFDYTDWTNGALPMFWSMGFAGGWQGGAFGALKRVPSLSDNLAWVKGSHTLKFGFAWDRWGNQQTDGGWQGNQAFPQGSYEFETYAQQTTGNPMADMLLGHANTFNQYAPDYVHTLWFTEAAAYAQDHWKVNRRLSLDFGIRFDHEGQWFPSGDTPGVPVWDPSTCTSTAAGPKCVGDKLPGLTWHGINKSIPLSGFESSFVAPDPRVGAAFDLFGNGRTVLRGGFGWYRYQWAYNSIPLNAPLGVQVFSTSCAITSWEQAVSSACTGPLTPTGQLPASNSGLSETAVAKGDNKTPYTQNWNFIIDQRGPWNSLISIGYNGSRSRNLLAHPGANNIPLGAYFGPDPVTGTNSCILPFYNPAGCTGNGLPSGTAPHFRPYNYNGVQVQTHDSYANYNALQVSWQKQAGKATFMLNYTWSKTMGIRDGQTDNGTGANGAIIDPFNLAANYGVLGYDRTHIFNAAYVITLPDPIRGNTFGQKLAGGIVNGWIVSGITQLQSGAPIQPSTNGNLNMQLPGGYGQQQVLGSDGWGQGALTEVLVCDPRKGLQSGYYFNPSCFAPPTTQGSFGTIVWPYIKGPAYFNSDLGLYKNFKITERQTLQFRVQAFNFLNHPLPDFTLAGNDTQLSFICNGCSNPSPLLSGLSMTNTNANTTGKPTFTGGRRVMEFSIKYMF